MWLPVLVVAFLGWGLSRLLQRPHQKEEHTHEAHPELPGNESKWEARTSRWAESSRPTGTAEYDVFFSHAGEQKKSFVDHVAASFARRYGNVRVFLDEYSLKPGKVPDEAIDSAMLCSPVAIVVLSPEFVRKRYPMYELEFLLAGHRQRKVTLVPVLYGLPYSHTQDLMAAYASEPWPVKEQRPPASVLERWAANVKELMGITAVRADQFRGDASLVEGLVDVVACRLREAGCAVVRHAEVQVKRNTVGLEPLREQLVALLRQHGMVVLHGMAGIGKTTLGNSAYDLLSRPEFGADVCVRMSFFAGMTRRDIKEQQGVVLHHLLGRAVPLVDVQDGQRQLVGALQRKKVLLLVDNAWDDQLTDALPADIMQLLKDTHSMVLVTSRDTKVADEFEPKPLLKEMMPLSDSDARRLFYIGAFGADAGGPAPADKAELATVLLQKCGGLPFAIEVTSKFLKGKPIGDWRRWEVALEEAFERQKALRIGEDKTLYAALQVSFDFLERHEVEFMLDIAFLVRRCGRSCRAIKGTFKETIAMGQHTAVGFTWQILGGYCGSALELLLSRGLIQQVDVGHPYGFEANLHDAVMSFCFSQLLEGGLYDVASLRDPSAEAVAGVGDLQIASSTHLAAVHQSTARSGELHRWVATAASRTAQQAPAPPCRVLWIDNAVWADSATAPYGVGFYLDMTTTMRFSQLQLLYFSAATWCRPVVPDQLLSCFPQLRLLHLRGVSNAALDLRGLTRLRHLVLERASELQSVVGWEDLSRLESLQISQCTGLDFSPQQGMSYLRSCELQECCMRDLAALQQLQNLERLRLWLLSDLTSLHGLSSLTSLESLTVWRCPNLTQAADLPSMVYLTHLDISGCNQLSSIGDMSASFHQLHALTINDCPHLTAIPPLGQLSKLAVVNILNCHSLMAYPDLHGAAGVRDLSVLACRVLTSLPGLRELTGVTQLAIHSCPLLPSIPDLSALHNLQQLSISSCDKLQQLPSPLSLPALTELNLQQCAALASIPAISSIGPSLHRLYIRECPSLPHVPGLARSHGLTSLQLASCDGLRSISDLDGCCHLQQLEISSCYGLTDLAGFGHLPALRSVKLEWCPALASLPDLAGAPHLQLLDVNKCAFKGLPSLHALARLEHLNLRAAEQLTSLVGLSGLRSLRGLSIVWGKQLLHLQGLGALTQLRCLALLDCPLLEALPDLGRLSALTHLNIEQVPAVQSMPWMPRLTALDTLLLRGCSGLRDVSDISALGQLTYLEVTGCEALTRIEGLEAQWLKLKRRLVRGCPALDPQH